MSLTLSQFLSALIVVHRFSLMITCRVWDVGKVFLTSQLTFLAKYLPKNSFLLAESAHPLFIPSDLYFLVVFISLVDIQ